MVVMVMGDGGGDDGGMMEVVVAEVRWWSNHTLFLSFLLTAFNAFSST